jgi:hypothetical protein
MLATSRRGVREHEAAESHHNSYQRAPHDRKQKEKNFSSQHFQHCSIELMNVLVKIFSKSLAKPLPLTALQAAICQIWGTGSLKNHLDHSSRDLQI